MPVMSRPRQKLTASEFLQWPDDGHRHELIDGVHYMTPSPKVTHDVVMSDYDVVEPDLLLVAGDQQHIVTEANVQGAPALVIEILSPGTRRRDEGIKRRLYDEKGVREYWLVDPKAMRVSICRRADDGSFPVVATVDANGGDQLTTPLLPGFQLASQDLFEEI